MTLHRHINAFLAASIAMLALSTNAHAGLIFAIGVNGTTPPVVGQNIPITLSNASQTASLQIFVFDDASEEASAGDAITNFAFKLRLDNTTAAKFTSAVPTGGLQSGVATVSPGGDFVTATGVFSTPQFIRTSANARDIGTFTLTGIGPGTSTVSIEENTAGNNDFILFQNIERDRRKLGSNDAFSGDGSAPGTAFTSGGVNSTVTAVPEPASSALVAGGLAVAFMARWRRRKQSRANPCVSA